MPAALLPDEALKRLRQNSDIAPGTRQHADIARLLASFGLDLVLWQFKSTSSSQSVRPTAAGELLRCPALILYVRRTSDLVAMGLPPGSGNWSGAWAQTDLIRDAMNRLLASHGRREGYLSDQMVVYVYAWEKEAYFILGRALKQRMAEMLTTLLPRSNSRLSAKVTPLAPRAYFGSYWGDEAGIPGQYNFLFPDAASMHVMEPLAQKFRHLASQELRQADHWGYCEDYRIGAEFFYSGMKDLPALYRED